MIQTTPSRNMLMFEPTGQEVELLALGIENWLDLGDVEFLTGFQVIEDPVWPRNRMYNGRRSNGRQASRIDQTGV
jgi:hypothetical protein